MPVSSNSIARYGQRAQFPQRGAEIVIEIGDFLDGGERHEVGNWMRLGDADQFLHAPNAAFLHQESRARTPDHG